MPSIPHLEKHFTATETVRDIVIGMADGYRSFCTRCGTCRRRSVYVINRNGWPGRDRRGRHCHGTRRVSRRTNRC